MLYISFLRNSVERSLNNGCWCVKRRRDAVAAGELENVYKQASCCGMQPAAYLNVWRGRHDGLLLPMLTVAVKKHRGERSASPSVTAVAGTTWRVGWTTGLWLSLTAAAVAQRGISVLLPSALSMC